MRYFIRDGETKVRGMTPDSGSKLVFVMSLAMVFGLLGLAVQPALLPVFFSEWQLSELQAGWLNGIFFAGYIAGVPVLITITDRLDARTVFLASSFIGFSALMGYALFAEGFWSALALRVLAGVGFAGTYMPGLKTLTDRIDRKDSSRAVAFYTASFGLGSALSFYLAGEINAALDWRWAFGLTAIGSLIAMALVFAAATAKKPKRHALAAALFDFRPVFRNRGAIGYILAYALHNWELMAVSAWTVAFLSFSASLQPDGASGWNITLIGAMAALVAMPASIGGNEVARRFGRRRTIAAFMVISAAIGAVIGFSAALPFGIVVTLCLIYSAATAADSASVTAGAVMSAAPEHYGATMAIHSFIGFGGAFLGPLMFGLVLDLTGGRQALTAWGTAFATIAILTLLGPLVLKVFSSNPVPTPNPSTD